MDTANTEARGRRDEPISELLRSLVSDMKRLASCEAALGAGELKMKTSEAKVAAGLIGIGAVIGFVAVLTLTAASILALSLALPAWAAAVIVGMVLLTVGTALVLLARGRFRTVTPFAPTNAINAVQEDIEWIRRKTEELKTTA
jgi:hypothetical protein